MSYSFPCELAEAVLLSAPIPATNPNFKWPMLEGITFMNSAGDTGAAECDYGNSTRPYTATWSPIPPVARRSLASAALDSLQQHNGTYFGQFSNGTNAGSLSQYAPEAVWNDAQEFGTSSAPPSDESNLLGNSGFDSWADHAGTGRLYRPRRWRRRHQQLRHVDENGVCTVGIPQPSYQSGITLNTIAPGHGGVLTTPARYSPDVSLLASIYWPGYIICTADIRTGRR